MKILLCKMAVSAHQKMASSYPADLSLIFIRWTPRACHTETIKMKVRVTDVETSFDLRQRFSSKDYFLLAPGDTWQLLEAFLVLTTWGGGETVCAVAIEWVEGGLLLNFLQYTGHSSCSEELCGSNVNTKVEKPWSKGQRHAVHTDDCGFERERKKFSFVMATCLWTMLPLLAGVIRLV